MAKIFIIMFGVSVSFTLIYFVFFLAQLYKDYNEAEKAHKKLKNENDYYL